MKKEDVKKNTIIYCLENNGEEYLISGEQWCGTGGVCIQEYEEPIDTFEKIKEYETFYYDPSGSCE